MDDTPQRVEDIDPVLAELLQQVANDKHPTIKSLYLSSSGLRVVRKPVRVEQKIGRNDPCHCGSGRKLKKCCGS